jgi:hypothetical protein
MQIKNEVKEMQKMLVFSQVSYIESLDPLHNESTITGEGGGSGGGVPG